MLDVKGGMTAYLARPYNGSSVYLMGGRVLVMYLEPPQAVYVLVHAGVRSRPAVTPDSGPSAQGRIRTMVKVLSQ